MEICRDFEIGKTSYTYGCEECGFYEDLYYHMKDDRPREYDCPTCNRNNSMHRIFGNNKIIIPFQWGDTENKISFDKSPSRRRHFW